MPLNPFWGLNSLANIDIDSVVLKTLVQFYSPTIAIKAHFLITWGKKPLISIEKGVYIIRFSK
jgi:hypothetical protein